MNNSATKMTQKKSETTMQDKWCLLQIKLSQNFIFIKENASQQDSDFIQKAV